MKLLKALPATQYDFRPDANGRSLGELAWHLAEGDAYMSFGVERGDFTMGAAKPPNIERPKTIEGLAPGHELVHRDAVARIRKLTPADPDRTIPFFFGERTIRDILWDSIIAHGIHHRGQLSLMCRLAGGVTPRISRSELGRNGGDARHRRKSLDDFRAATEIARARGYRSRSTLALLNLRDEELLQRFIREPECRSLLPAALSVSQPSTIARFMSHIPAALPPPAQ